MMVTSPASNPRPIIGDRSDGAPALGPRLAPGWLPSPTEPVSATLSLEDLLVEVFARLLDEEARGIARDAAAITKAAEAYAASGDPSALEGQTITEARLALRERMKDREHTFSMVLGILESLNQSAQRALESLGK